MEKFDIAIIGSGMGGSACATVFAKLGYQVLLLERGSHPRFAIGESATPVMSKKIRFIGEAYDIPEFDQLSTYDKIKASGNPMTCGPKELFHYYVHTAGQTEVLHRGVLPELIVQTPEVDVQFLRADSDKYVVDVAERYGVTYHDHTSVDDIDFGEDGVIIHCTHNDKRTEYFCQFVIDGTGYNSIIGNKFKLKIQGDQLETPLKSRSIFTHFRDIGNFEAVLKSDPGFIDRSPVPRSRATQHHCFDGGWVWLIPFEDGVTSVGVNLDLDKFPMNDKDGADEFWEIISRYPIIHDLLRDREIVRPFTKTGRLQFLNQQLVGARWAMLPASAYGLDAWFSTGLAVSFMAIHRLAELLHERVFPQSCFDRRVLMDYEEALKKEFHHVSKMVHGMYKSFKHFDVFKHYCFLCFMGSENYLEHGGIYRGMDMEYLLLSAGDPRFVEKFETVYKKVIEYSNRDSISAPELDSLNRFIREDMAPFNFRKFGDPDMHGVHPRRVMDDSRHRLTLKKRMAAPVN
jgi:tetracycline 7-halogenase / FADH2 O2-dependent halogenase